MQNNESLDAMLLKLGIYALNEMQEKSLQHIPQEPNLMLLAPTGSGKTLAFLLPILSLLQKEQVGVQCLIISPTRELAIQIERVWQKMSTGYKVNTCYGGHPMQTEIRNLSQPPALLIGTPGRLIEHLARKSFDPKNLKVLVLDEFDKSLSLGFQEQIEQIVVGLPNIEKRILVSASQKQHIPKFTGIVAPKILDFTNVEDKSTDGLQVKAVMTSAEGKLDALFALLCVIGAEQTLVFCNQRDATERCVELLRYKGLQSSFFHGGLDQLDREKTLVKFRNGSIAILVASDLAARGLDIPEVRNVIHFELPDKGADFVHRNGRTARMHAGGTAFVLLPPEETLPDYLPGVPEIFDIPAGITLPEPPAWTTLYVSGGKKDKLSKTDIVGFLSKKGDLRKEDLGKIELLDHMSFVAVKKDKVQGVLKKIAGEKMKGAKYKIEVVR
ncbi:MAG: DEAD/DEAH box helicase [Haliscomenobacter sp.]|uniref:DEAD/DEAH box helicase n=1 Tax=Haliscomenobacter sp. TaxID=2717303 RepID=UPI0029A64F26|nr:DEAD/DEAH box helicase [Haliscomenobacter sp.]MDX2067936.1 DEAD/DEAH box helicase [Haliscomenobacter sp.]